MVRAVLHYLEDDWALQIYHGRDNLEYIKEELTRDYDAEGSYVALGDDESEALLSRITFSSLVDVHDTINSDNRWPNWLTDKWGEWTAALKVQEEETGRWNLDRHVYSQILLEASFWDNVIAEHVLIFQTDSWLCKTGLESYLDYDWVGAPWKMCTFGPDHIFHRHCLGGNGGLSLRKKSSQLQMIREHKRQTINEDYQFALWMYADRDKRRYKTLPLEEAKDVFCEELQTSHGGPPIGLHKAWAYQGGSATGELLSHCMADLRPALKTTVHDEL